MKIAIRLMAVATGLLAAQIAVAQAPAGSTGQCKDGTYSTAASKQGACRGHQGVKEWYAAAPAGAPAPAAAAPKSAAAAAPAAGPKPADATGLCNDGTYATSTSKSAGCRGHQGVKEWYAAAAAPAAAKTATAATPTTPAPAPAAAPTSPKIATQPAPAATPAATTKASPASKAASMTQAAGGGPGLVWVNSDSNVYHCYGTTYYGKTKQGSYMSEADAKAKGAHADHGHACSK
jgi:Protein of unknown function (DUF3761)